MDATFKNIATNSRVCYIRRRPASWRIAFVLFSGTPFVSSFQHALPFRYICDRSMSFHNRNLDLSATKILFSSSAADPRLIVNSSLIEQGDSLLQGYEGMLRIEAEDSMCSNSTLFDKGSTKQDLELLSISTKPEIEDSSLKGSVRPAIKRVATKPKNIRKPKDRKVTTRSLSSTMPGLGIPSDRQRAYRSGLRLAEESSGRRLVENAEQRRNRSKLNGEAMYKNSASVPDSMVHFADLIHQQDRITHKEEIELGCKTQEAIKIQNIYDSLISRLNREPTDEEWCAAAGKINMEAIRQTIDEGLDAKNKLVTSNLRMVQSVVNAYIRNGLSAHYNAGDMMQDGTLALIRAAEKFEPDRGWKFSTYAMYWVRASVKRSQISQSRVITVPQRLFEKHKRLKRVEEEMTRKYARTPTQKELGDAVGMSELQVNRCLAAMNQRCYSLDQQLNNSRKPMSDHASKNSLLDILESKTAALEKGDVDRELIRQNLIESLHRHLSCEEVELLSLRYGLIEPPSQKQKHNSVNRTHLVTIAELSRVCGLKPDKVRRMINNSLKQLKAVAFEEYLAFEKDLQ